MRTKNHAIFVSLLVMLAFICATMLITAPVMAQGPALGYAQDGRVCCECWIRVTPTPPATHAISYTTSFYANEYGETDCSNICWREFANHLTVEMIGGYKTERGCREYGFYMPLIQKLYSR